MNHLQRHGTFIVRYIKHQLGLFKPSPVTPSQPELSRLELYVQDTIGADDTEDMIQIESLPLFKKTFYSYDLYSNFIFSHLKPKFRYEFGDVRDIPIRPTFVKSRPINSHNQNSMILPLEISRHFDFIEDWVSFDKKINQICWRGACYQPWRKQFLKAAQAHAFCDVGDTSKHSDAQNRKGSLRHYLSREDQLQYKFLFSIEGNDVASNLKWAMNSNSVVMMTRPKFETWFCESQLLPGVHYIPIKDDFSDLAEQFEYYSSNPKACIEISRNAREYTSQFLNQERQYALGGLAIDRYHDLTSGK